MPLARHTTRGHQPKWCVVIVAVLLAFAATCASAQRSGNGLPPEAVQADVSTRTVGITSNFTGTEIIVFGAISNAREPKTKRRAIRCGCRGGGCR